MNTIKYKPGVSLDNLPIGEYRIIFEDIDGWITPETEIIKVKQYEKTILKGTYRRKKGFIQINIPNMPEDAYWSLDGEGEYPNGHIIEDLPTGDYTISFSEEYCWIAPNPITITVTENSSPTVNVSYIKKKGNVKVNIANVPPNFYWSVNDEGVYPNGYTKYNLNACEKYTISFSEIPNWDKPEDEEVTITPNTTIEINKEYIRHTGHVKVIIDGPITATWKLDNDDIEYLSNHTIYNLITGNQYTITFTNVFGWLQPNDVIVTIPSFETVEIHVKYIELCPGRLQVCIQKGPENSYWVLDEETTYHNNESIILQADTYTITFPNFEEWITPEEQNIIVYPNTITTVNVEYVYKKGNLQVILTNAAPTAYWFVKDIEGQYASDYILEDLDIGQYTLSFSEIPNCITPEDMYVIINPGETTIVEIDYALYCPGGLIVLIQGAPFALWHLNNSVKGYERFEPLSLSAGSYDVSFDDAPGWMKPENTEATIYSGELTVVDVEYTQAGQCPGNLQVIINGALPDGKWFLEKDKDIYERGFLLRNLTNGTYVVQFTDVEGWIKPEDIIATIISNETTIVTATYKKLIGFGNLQVKITSMDMLGVWYLNDSSGYQRDRTIYNLSSENDYMVTFSDVPGWIKPQSRSVEIFADTTTVLEVEYIKQIGNLQVQITGADPEGVWFLQGDQYQPYYLRGDIISDLSVGTYEVFFTDVDGWITPTNIVADVLANTTTIVEGVYRKMTGHLQVKIIGADPFGMWKLTNTDYYPRNFIIYDLDIGQYTVQFKHVAGWFTPDDMIAEIIHNEIAVITVVTGVYHKNVDDPIWPPPDDPDDPDPEYYPKLSVRMFEKIPIDTMGYLQVIIENIEEDPNWYDDNVAPDWTYSPDKKGIWDFVDGISYSGVMDGQFEHAHSVFVEQGVRYVGFKNIIGWRKPVIQEVFIETKQTTVLRVRYEPLSGPVFGAVRINIHLEEPDRDWDNL